MTPVLEVRVKDPPYPLRLLRDANRRHDREQGRKPFFSPSPPQWMIPAPHGLAACADDEERNALVWGDIRRREEEARALALPNL